MIVDRQLFEARVPVSATNQLGPNKLVPHLRRGYRDREAGSGGYGRRYERGIGKGYDIVVGEWLHGRPTALEIKGPVHSCSVARCQKIYFSCAVPRTPFTIHSIRWVGLWNLKLKVHNICRAHCQQTLFTFPAC